MLKLCKRFLAFIVLALLVVTIVGCDEIDEVAEVTKKLTLSDATITLTVGDTKAITAKYYENDVETTAEFGYKSSDLAVVSLKGNTIQAVGAGTATVTAYVVGHDEVKAECEVTVSKKIVEEIEPVKHALTLALDGGVYDGAPTEYTEGVALRLAAPTKDGYRFLGWQKAESEALILALTGEEKEDLTLTAKWEKIDERVPLTTAFEVKTFAELEALVPEAGKTTTEKYYTIGYVAKVDNVKYGDIYIEDADGNQLYIYGIYDQDGNVKFADMVPQPAEGDIVVLYGVMTNYKDTIEMKNAWLVEYNGYVFEHASTERTVALILGDGKVDKDVTSYTIGTEVELPTPTKEGYTFLGWYNGDTKVEKITAKDKANLVLVAKWEKIVAKEYNVTADLDGGKLESQMGIDDNATVYYSWGISQAGETYGALTAKLAYVSNFEKINVHSKLMYQNVAYIKYNAAYNAWEIIKVKNDTKTSEQLGMIGVAEYVLGGTTDATVIAITADTSNEGRFVVFDQDITTLAKGECAVVAKIYDKTAFVNKGEVPATIAEGAEAALPTPTKEGYKFLGWYEGETKVEKLVGNKDYNLVAKWEKIINKHTVTINLTEGEITAYKAVNGDPIAKLHFTKLNGLYTNVAAEGYVAEIVDGKAEGANTLRWQYKIVLTYDKAVGAYKIVGVDAATKTLANMGVGGDYVIATLKDAEIIKLSADESLVGKYVVFNRDIANITATDVDFYGTIGDAAQIVDGADVTEFVEGEVLVLPEAKREGYWRFVGWTDGKDVFTAIAADKLENVTLTPVWEEVIIEHKITWNLDGGTCEDLPEVFIEGKEDIILPTNPTKDGYEFLGWEIKGRSVTKINCKLTEDVEVVATWCKEGEKPVYHTLTLELDGGTLEDAPERYQEGVGLTLPEPTKEHCDFAGWYKGETKVEKISKLQTGDVTLTAHWTFKVHAITYVLDGGENNEANPDTYSETIGVTLADPTKEHFNFAGWYIGEEKVTGVDTLATEDVEVTAKWERITHNITYVLNGGTNATDAPTTYGEGVGLATLPVVTPVDWKIFDGWYIGEEKVTAIADTEVADVTLTAKYVDGKAMIAKVTYLDINAAMKAAKDKDTIVLCAGEHILTQTSTAKVTIEGPNKGVKYDGTRVDEAILKVNTSSAGYELANASIVFDGITILSTYANDIVFLPLDSCLSIELKNSIVKSTRTTGYKIRDFFRLEKHTEAMTINVNNSLIQDVDQMFIFDYSNNFKGNFVDCEFNCSEAYGAQLFRIKPSCAKSVINVIHCNIKALTNGMLAKAESGNIYIKYCRIYNNNAAAHLKPTSGVSGTVTYDDNFFDNSSNTSGGLLSGYAELEEKYSLYANGVAVTYLSNGGLRADGAYALKTDATPIETYDITHSGYAYAGVTAVDPYISNVTSLIGVNGLASQPKVYLRYNTTYDAYEIVCVDNCTKSTSNLGMLGYAEYVMGGMNNAQLIAMAKNTDLVGKLVLFDAELTSLAKDCTVKASIYDKSAFEEKATELELTYDSTKDLPLPKMTKAGETFIGWFDANGNKISTFGQLNGKTATLTAKYAKHIIDWADGTVGGKYTNANWTQEQYTTSWVSLSGQMNCREKDGMRVVNMAGGYGMTRRFTYTPSESMGLINFVQFAVGNYYSNAKEMSIKVALIDKDGNVKYIYGNANTFATLPVTTGMIQLALTFDDFEVSQVRFVMKSSINGDAFLYVGPVAFGYNNMVYDFGGKTVKHQTYNDVWSYGPVEISGGANNNAGWAFIKFGAKSKTTTNYIKTEALKYDATELIVKFGGFESASCFAKAGTREYTVKVACYSDAECTTLVSETAVQAGPEIAQGGDPVCLTFNGTWAKGTYLAVIITCTNTTTTNGVTNVQWISIK